MAILRFQTNIPMSLHMQVLTGKPVESQFGGMQHMFYAQEGMFYVSDKVGGILAEQFATLGVKPGDAVEITKAEEGSGPGRRTRWQVALCIPTGEQPDGTLAVPRVPEAPTELEQKLADSIRLVEARKAAQRAESAVPAWTQMLVTQTNALVDAYAQVLKHSAKHEGLVKGEDIRSIFLSAFINVSKGGQRNVA